MSNSDYTSCLHSEISHFLQTVTIWGESYVPVEKSEIFRIEVRLLDNLNIGFISIACDYIYPREVIDVKYLNKKDFWEKHTFLLKNNRF